jgi:hypothetical protein
LSEWASGATALAAIAAIVGTLIPAANQRGLLRTLERVAPLEASMREGSEAQKAIGMIKDRLALELEARLVRDSRATWLFAVSLILYVAALIEALSGAVWASVGWLEVTFIVCGYALLAAGLSTTITTAIIAQRLSDEKASRLKSASKRAAELAEARDRPA